MAPTRPWAGRAFRQRILRPVELAVPGDLSGKDFWIVRDQNSVTYFLLHVPQDEKSAIKGKLKVGNPPE